MPLPLSPSTDMDDELNWLDRLRADAGVPETVNTEDAVLVHFNVCDERVVVHTYRRWPVGYFMMGRERRISSPPLSLSPSSVSRKPRPCAARLRRPRAKSASVPHPFKLSLPPSIGVRPLVNKRSLRKGSFKKGEAPGALATDAPVQQTFHTSYNC